MISPGYALAAHWMSGTPKQVSYFLFFAAEHEDTGTFEMFLQYSQIVRSEENLPDRAVFHTE
jgi:hypothetical protein